MTRLCVCGIEEIACLREQQRAETREPCDDRIAARVEDGEGFHCAWCEAPTLHEDGHSPDEANGDLICEACNAKIEQGDRCSILCKLDDNHAGPCDDGITRCPGCDEPTHASESDDTGRCARCRACYYCDAEATRTGIERDIDDNARVLRVCEECGVSSDRAERLRQIDIKEGRL